MPEQNNEMTQEQEQEVNESLDQLNEFKKQLEEVKENNESVNKILADYLQFNIDKQIAEQEQLQANKEVAQQEEKENQEFKMEILDYIKKDKEFNENLILSIETLIERQEQLVNIMGENLNKTPELKETVSDNVLGIYGLIIIPIIIVVYGFYKLINMWIKPFT